MGEERWIGNRGATHNKKKYMSCGLGSYLGGQLVALVRVDLRPVAGRPRLGGGWGRHLVRGQVASRRLAGQVDRRPTEGRAGPTARFLGQSVEMWKQIYKTRYLYMRSISTTIHSPTPVQ